MKLGWKIYNTSFKTNAVEVSNERTTISKLSKELGIKANLL